MYDQPAFPGPVDDQENWVGISDRDYFAAKAMQAFLDRGFGPTEVGGFTKVANWSYEAAEAMLKARDGK